MTSSQEKYAFAQQKQNLRKLLRAMMSEVPETPEHDAAVIAYDNAFVKLYGESRYKEVLAQEAEVVGDDVAQWFKDLS